MNCEPRKFVNLQWHDFGEKSSEMNPNQMKKNILFLFLVLSLAVKADPFDDIVNALKMSNAKEVSKFFNSTVELTVVNTEGVYSKPQAEMILKDFFSANPPKTVSIQHRGSSSQGSKYAIANYVTAQGKFRVYIFMKESPTGMLIHELRFEKE